MSRPNVPPPAATPAPPPAAPAEGRAKHPVDEVPPPGKLAVYGVQHVLAFYAGAVIVPILLASAIGLSDRELIHLINADLFTCGIASIIQSVGFWKVGVRLPLLQGVTFTAVSPMIAIGLAAGGGTEGLTTIYGAVIVAGLFTFFLAPYFSRLIRFFPPVVTGSVITIIGIALLPVAANDAAGGNPSAADYASLRNLAYAAGTLAFIVLIYRLSRGFLSTVAVLIGLAGGTAVATVLGHAHFDNVTDSAWVGVTTPFHFGWPQFSLAAILSMIVVMLITAVETTGDVFATGEIVKKRIGREDIARALRADGLATTIGGVFNSFPYTCFAENVGLVRLTRIQSRWVIAAAGAFMIVIGLVPKAGAVVAGIPHPVLGGAALAMFGTVAAVGIQILSRVDFHSQRNVVIVAVSIGMALVPIGVPGFYRNVPPDLQIIFGSGITTGCLSAILLNLFFNVVGRRRVEAVVTEGSGRLTVGDVNSMSREEFVEVFSRLFQGPAWVAERACDSRPFASAHDLRAAFQDALFSLPREQQRELMASYPELGSEAVLDGLVGEETTKDQASAGLNLLGDDDHEEFAELNRIYRDRFGMPLIVCARDASQEQILEGGWSRMDNSPAQEHATALLEIAKIANHRLGDLVAETNPVHAQRVQRFERLH